MAHTQFITSCRKALTLLLLLIPGASFTYAQQWHTTIEISHAAAVQTPAHVHELLLVNNTVAHPDYPMSAFFALMAASEMLEGSDYTPAVLESSQNNSVSLYRKQLLSTPEADSLLHAYNSDGLLALNQIIVHPTTEEFVTDNDTYYSSIRAIVASHWTIYCRPTAEAQEITARSLTLADTLYWENEASSIEAARSALPTMGEVYNEMSVYAGERMAQRLLPQTEEVDRYLYDLGKDDQGMYHFTRKQWLQAIQAWQQPWSDTKLAAYAAANCAVTYEILGDREAAYAAGEQALNLFSQLRSADARQQAVNIRYYLTLLQ